MKQYRGIIRNRLMEDFTYREHFITNLISKFVFYIVLYFLWKAIYKSSNGMINGITFEQTYVSLTLCSCLVSCFETEIEWNMHFEMLDGNIIIKLVRPMNYMKYMFCEKIGASLCSLIINLVPIWIVMAVAFPSQICIRENILVFMLCMILAFSEMFFLEFITGVFSFYTQSVWGISMIKSVIISFFSGSVVPVAFFPDVLKRISDFLPFQTMYYAPVGVLTGSTRGMDIYMRVLSDQIIWSVLLFCIARVMYGFMKKRIVVNGG